MAYEVQPTEVVQVLAKAVSNLPAVLHNWGVPAECRLAPVTAEHEKGGKDGPDSYELSS